MNMAKYSKAGCNATGWNAAPPFTHPFNPSICLVITSFPSYSVFVWKAKQVQTQMNNCYDFKAEDFSLNLSLKNLQKLHLKYNIPNVNAHISEEPLFLYASFIIDQYLL